MLVKMIKTTPGSKDGISVQKYEAGKEYNLPESLASAFVSVGVAEEVKAVNAPANKTAGPAPDNKAGDSGKDNKKKTKEEEEKEAEEEAKRILAEQNAGKDKGRNAVKDKG